ncbi:MAG TPA: carboxypeptidase regulatory-like domain-containing protein [Terriglobia bacterium]|nr:carboxypeptidase regulatory-like domain-containing protein [Terriglobia bacterium]
MRAKTFLYGAGILAVMLAITLCTGPAAMAQTAAGGTVEGQVLGPGEVPVPGARVVLFNPQTRERKQTWSDEAGKYVFSSVAPGEYRVIVVILGFRPSLLGPVTVTAGKPLTLNATLTLGVPGEQAGFGGFRRQGAGQGGAGRGNFPGRASEAGSGGRAGIGRGSGQFPQQGRGNAGGSFPAQGTAGPEDAGDLNSILAEAGGNDATGGLSFSDEGAGTGQTNQAGGIGGDLAGAAGASNSFLLAGNVVNATAPTMAGGRRGRGFRFGGGPGGPGGPGGEAGMPFGGGGGGDRVFFFGGFRRPGSNQIRGNINESYTNSAFDARPYPLNTPSQPQVPYYSELFGFSLGGPLNIPRLYNGGNKTSFFFNFNIIRGTSPQNILASLPTAAERQGDFSATTIASGPGAGTMPVIYEPTAALEPRTAFPGNVVPSSMLNSASLGLLQYLPMPNLPGQVQNYHVQLSLPTASQIFMARVGREISSKDNLAVVYFYDSSHADGLTGFPNIPSTTTTRRQNVSVTETHNFSTRAVNDFAVNFNRARTLVTNPFSYNRNITGELGIQGVSQDPRDWGLPSIGFTNFSELSDASPSLTRNQTLSFSDSLLYTVGKHNFEFGGEVSRIQLNSLTNPEAQGSFSFTGYSTSDFTTQGTPVTNTGYDLADFLLGLPQTTSERYGIPANYLRSSRYDVYGQDDWRVSDHFTLDLGARWEYAAPFTEKYGHLSDLALGPNFSTADVVTGQNPGSLPASLLSGHPENVAPRVGIAYRPWISHSLVVRAGYGMFYDESIYQNLVSNLVNQAPFATTSTLVTSPSQLLTLQNGFPTINPGTVSNTYAVDPGFLTPYAQTWNATVEQNLGQSYVLSAAYIGTRGTHLNLLLVPGVGSALASITLPFEYDTSGASSLYNGLRVSLRHFSRRDFSFFLNYTYSKAEDNASSVGGTATTRFFRIGGPGGLGGGSAISAAVSPLAPVQNPSDLGAEWALSGFNPTHSLRGFVRYQLPFGERGRFLKKGGVLSAILSRWSLSDIMTVSSGLPYTAYVGGNASNNVNGLAPFGGLRADATGVPVTLPSSQRTTLNYFNTGAFALPVAGAFGNAGRNTIPGPPTINFDVGLDRLITISREKNITGNFRLATSNTFNIVNFSGLSTTINSNTFGRVNAVGAMRTMTLSFRLRF